MICRPRGRDCRSDVGTATTAEQSRQPFRPSCGEAILRRSCAPFAAWRKLRGDIALPDGMCARIGQVPESDIEGDLGNRPCVVGQEARRARSRSATRYWWGLRRGPLRRCAEMKRAEPRTPSGALRDRSARARLASIHRAASTARRRSQARASAGLAARRRGSRQNAPPASCRTSSRPTSLLPRRPPGPIGETMSWAAAARRRPPDVRDE